MSPHPAFKSKDIQDVDGRGECIWDRFCATEGKVKNGDDGTRACEHFVRYPEDIKLMQELGVDAYRFSIAWPRILPTGFEKNHSKPDLTFTTDLLMRSWKPTSHHGSPSIIGIFLSPWKMLADGVTE